MDQKLPRLYKEYGQYSNYRNFPLDLDGLKPVERRVLLAAYKIARNKLVISRKVDSYTTGNYHPHGECYGTIVQLVKQGFLIGKGSFGSNVGVEPTGAAAPRYTQCRIDPRTIDLAFKYVNHVEWVDTELEDREPLYLPTMYPICLLGNEPTQGIGFGYKTYIPCYTAEDLHKRLLWLLKIRKREPVIAPISDCTITAPKEELQNLLTTGKAKIDVKGIIDINARTNTVILKSWPPGKRFQSILNKFSKELSDGLIGYRDASSKQTEIEFKILRERNRDKIFADFVDKLKEVIKGTISFETITVALDHTVALRSIDEMLLNTFASFTNANEAMLKAEQTKITEVISELNLLEKIREPLSDCISKKYTVEQTAKAIEEVFSIPSESVIHLVGKYRISKLLTLSTDTSELNNQLKSIKDTLKNISDYVLNQYGGFK